MRSASLWARSKRPIPITPRGGASPPPRTSAQGRKVAGERDKARYALGFLVDTFKEADPYHTKGERLSADEILARGAERVSRDLSGQPDVQAALMDAIGEVELGLGRFERAEP